MKRLDETLDVTLDRLLERISNPDSQEMDCRIQSVAERLRSIPDQL